MQNNLGNTLLGLGQRKTSTKLLKQAVVAYRAALKEFPCERAPLKWAIAQTNLGVALWALGRQGKDSDLLKQAVAAHRAALARVSREQDALEWATVQTNLGNALWALGYGTKDSDFLKQAAVCPSGGARGTPPRACAAQVGNSTERSGDRPVGLREARTGH